MLIEPGRTNQQGFTMVELMIVVSIITLLAALAISSFYRARQRTQATITLNGVRLLDDAIDQWTFEYGVANSATITLASLAPYIKSGSSYEEALLAGNSPTDALGNAYLFGNVGPGQVTVNSATKNALSGVIDWGPY